ncbi:MAG TPA: FmdB family transcriptional regulator [Planctomycetaceae bacterium]|nr:FmdB family transcriptional regulator [Planctomycetaceae bacterium]
MPTYEYRCSACGHRLEEFQYITDEPLKKCPACKKNKLQRQISGGAAIVFKGSGFYQTDYRSESYQKDAEASKGAKSSKPDASTGDSKTELKAEPKTESKKSTNESAKP